MDKWETALNNSNRFLREKNEPPLEVGKFSYMEQPDMLKLNTELSEILRTYNPSLKEITFDQDVETGYELGNCVVTYESGKMGSPRDGGDKVKSVSYPAHYININPQHLRKGEDGNVYQISNGMTHKRMVNGQEYVGIENILTPADIILLHEIGHSLYREKRGSIIHERVDAPSKRRKYSPLSGGGEYINSEDAMNIMGVSPVNENFFRHEKGLPLRYGYLSPSSLGNRVFYIKKDKVLRDVGMIAQLERGEGFLKEEPVLQVWTDDELNAQTEVPHAIEFVNHAIHKLTERNDDVDTRNLVTEFMNLTDTRNFQKGDKDYDGLGSLSASNGVKLENWCGESGVIHGEI